jgi:hypothetical protein
VTAAMDAATAAMDAATAAMDAATPAGRRPHPGSPIGSEPSGHR